MRTLEGGGAPRLRLALMEPGLWLRERLPPVERALCELLEPGAAMPPRLREAMAHALWPGGKRLRPALALAAAEAVAAPAERALPMAVAVELVHSYSLVHDDLPCMDDDDLRRGRPTVHRAFDEATAVLAGDALLTLAFEVLAGDGPERGRALAELARAAGAAGLVGGQVDDLSFDAADVDAAGIESIHARKSAALIAAALVGGATLAGADQEACEALRRCGIALGVAFQIADDLLDAEEDGGCSLLRVATPEQAGRRAEALLAVALSETERFGASAEPLRALARYAVRRSA
jgi:geranylgeranyl pyrophosphate synthase